MACKNEDKFPSNFFNQPWIIQCHGGNKDTTTFIDPMITKVEDKEIVDIKGKLCFGCIDEWIFLWDEQSKECFFLNLSSLSKVHLPPLPRECGIITNFCLSSSPNELGCIVIFIGAELDEETNIVTRHFIMCCRSYDKMWTKLPLDEDDQNIIGATCAILNEKLYASNVDGIIVFNVSSLFTGQLETQSITGPTLAIYPRTDNVSKHLVESCGHIYLVRFYSYGGGPIINIDIHRFDTSSNIWLRIDSIGQHAFFLSDMCYTSVCAVDVGASCNCIYYMPLCCEDEQRIYKFNLDDYTMSFSLTPIEKTEYESRFCWFVPRREQQTITYSSLLPTIILNEACHDIKSIKEKISKHWDELPMDLLELVMSHVSLVDSLRIWAVCKSWNLHSDLAFKAKTWPWLMYQEKPNDTYKLLDSLNEKEYKIKVGVPSPIFPTQMLCSKNGWVVVLGENNAMFFINPISQDVVNLPPLEVYDESFHGITFTSAPTSSDCVLMGIHTERWNNLVEIHVWRFGEEECSIIYDDEIPFNIANTNPVFIHEELYCLGEIGELGVFNLVEATWMIFEKPKPIYLEDEAPFRGTEDCYLLELGGELVSVFKYNYSDYEICVFRLDRLNMEWIQVDDLSGWTLFLDPRSSFAKPSPHKSWSNKIFFTAVHSRATKTCIAYCMKSKSYEIDFSDTIKPLDCVWLEPNLMRNS